MGFSNPSKDIEFIGSCNGAVTITISYILLFCLFVVIEYLGLPFSGMYVILVTMARRRLALECLSSSSGSRRLPP